MTKIFRRLTLVAVGFVILIVMVIPATIYATTIIKSKSNIANNRPIVLSTTLSQANATDGGRLLLLDTETGEIWEYSYKSLTGGAPPKYVSTMQGVGDPVLVEQKYVK